MSITLRWLRSSYSPPESSYLAVIAVIAVKVAVAIITVEVARVIIVAMSVIDYQNQPGQQVFILAYIIRAS